jgi:hypothetical protein
LYSGRNQAQNYQHGKDAPKTMIAGKTVDQVAKGTLHRDGSSSD